jgi:hypothetical protein
MQIPAPDLIIMARRPWTPENGYLAYPESFYGRALPGIQHIPAKLIVKSPFSLTLEVQTDGKKAAPPAMECEIKVEVWLNREDKGERAKLEPGLELELVRVGGTLAGRSFRRDSCQPLSGSGHPS